MKSFSIASHVRKALDMKALKAQVLKALDMYQEYHQTVSLYWLVQFLRKKPRCHLKPTSTTLQLLRKNLISSNWFHGK